MPKVSRIPRSAGGQCVGHEDGCPDPVLPECPVPLCGRHLRKVYEFADGLIVRDGPSAASVMAETAIGRRVASVIDGSRASASSRATGFVYFVTFGDRLKIGFSIDVARRLINLPHDELLGAIPGTLRDEAAWHRALIDYRIKGEWFRAEPPVLAVVRRVLAANAA